MFGHFAKNFSNNNTFPPSPTIEDYLEFYFKFYIFHFKAGIYSIEFLEGSERNDTFSDIVCATKAKETTKKRMMRELNLLEY